MTSKRIPEVICTPDAIADLKVDPLFVPVDLYPVGLDRGAGEVGALISHEGEVMFRYFAA